MSIVKLVLAVSSILIVTCGSVSAQDSSAQIIPVAAKALQVDLSPDGQTIAVYQFALSESLPYEVNPDTQPVRLIDAASGTERAALTGPTDYAVDVAFSPDSTTLAAYYPNGYLDLWNVATGAQIKEIPAFPGISRIEFLDNSTLAMMMPSGVSPAVFLLWDINTESITRVITNRLNTFSDFAAVNSDSRLASATGAVGFSPETHAIAVMTYNGTLQLFDATTGAMRVVRERPADQQGLFTVNEIRFADGGNTLVFFDSETKAIHFIDAASGQEVRAISVAAWFDADQVFASLALSPDGTRIALIGRGQSAHLFIVNLDQPDAPTEIALPPLPGEVAPGSVTTLEFTPDGSRLVLGGFFSETTDNGIVVLDVP